VLSLIDLIEMLQQRLGRDIPVQWDEWRPGDQQVYISDIRKLENALSWKPEVSVTSGIAQLVDWVAQNRAAF
jgi:CDP-paratose 2-epimerase